MKNWNSIILPAALLTAIPLIGQESPPASEQEKHRQIGSTEWLTEENSLDEVLAAAQQRKLPVLAIFSAKWCGPCQQMKETALKKPGFASMAEEAVLLYIEQTREKGQEWCKKFAIRAYPTIKVLSFDGVQWEEMGSPERTPEGFLEWIRRVKAGDNLYCLRQKVEKSPKDRRSLVLLAEKEMRLDIDRGLDLLDRALAINGDFDDDLTQRALENRAVGLSWKLIRSAGRDADQAKKIASGNLSWVESLIRAYAPDKFAHGLKTGWMTVLLPFFNQAEKWGRTTALFETHAAATKPFNWKGHALVLSNVVDAYYHAGEAEKARTWVSRLIDHATSGTSGVDMHMAYALKQAIDVSMKHRLSADRAEAEKWFTTILKRVGAKGFANFFPAVVNQYGIKEGLAANAFLALLDEAIANADGGYLAFMASMAVRIHARQGNNDRAINLVLRSAEKLQSDAKSGSSPQQRADALNTLAWACVEAEIFDPRVLELAQNAVSLSRTALTLDTLACLHAGLEEYDKAIVLETEALGVQERESERDRYTTRIKAWKKKRVVSNKAD